MLANKQKTNTQTSRAQPYFTEINIANKTHKCNECGKLITATKIANLVSHLRSSHQNVYNTVINPRRYIVFYKRKRLKFIQNITEIVAINGRPFSYLNDSGFQKLVEDDLNELKEADCGISLDDKSEIKAYMASLAGKIKEKIKSEARGRAVSLMVDIAKKNNRSFLGLSVQYFVNGMCCVRCLGTLELKKAHTARYIKEIMMNCLLLFDISLDQIVSITTDNGANMLAMVDLFNNEDESDIANDEADTELNGMNEIGDSSNDTAENVG